MRLDFCVTSLAGLVLATAAFENPLQAIIPGLLPGIQYDDPVAEKGIEFRLAHILHHGTIDYPGLYRRLDVKPGAPLWLQDEEFGTREVMPAMIAQPTTMKIQRLCDRTPLFIDSMLATARMVGQPASLPASSWTVDDIRAPNASHKRTMLTFARAAANAYVEEPWTGEWQEMKGSFNYTEDFGWESDGIRGHVFADEKNQTVLIGMKGTTVAVFDGSGSTTNDKLNDNLFFGCCCGEESYMAKKPCSCRTSTYTCNSTCVTQALREKNRYYYAAKQLYYNVTELYPNADVWLAGHSLGGSVASLLGMTFGLPVMTFEAPGEAMAASRLGLPTPPGYRIGDHEPAPSSGTYHFGHNADPLFLGTCGAACYTGGYAMESVCHSGMECVYNVTGDLGWGSHIVNHGIQTVLHQVLEAYNDTAKCEVVTDCNDCYLWKYFKSNSSDSTTTSSSSSSSYTQTRTETCKTPGWWGCLDETTSTPTMTTTSATSTSTSTDVPTTPTTSTTTCATPGKFWGCWDDKKTTAAMTIPSQHRPVATPTEPIGSWFAHELVDALR